MKRTFGLFAVLATIFAPTAHAFAMTQTDLYQSYALAYATDVALDASVSIDGDTLLNPAAIDTNAEAAIDTDSSIDINSDATVEEGSTFTFTRSDMSETASMNSANRVATRSDLEAYASTQMKDDERMDHAAFSNTAVSVWYKYPAKFLGVIPTDMTVEATVDSSGTATVTYPWYSFLLSSADKADLEADIQQRVSANSEGNSSTFSTRTQAEVLADLRAALASSAN